MEIAEPPANQPTNQPMAQNEKQTATQSKRVGSNKQLRSLSRECNGYGTCQGWVGAIERTTGNQHEHSVRGVLLARAECRRLTSLAGLTYSGGGGSHVPAPISRDRTNAQKVSWILFFLSFLFRVCSTIGRSNQGADEMSSTIHSRGRELNKHSSSNS